MNYHYIVLDLEKLEVVTWYRKAKIFLSKLDAECFCINNNIENYKTIQL